MISVEWMGEEVGLGLKVEASREVEKLCGIADVRPQQIKRNDTIFFTIILKTPET